MSLLYQPFYPARLPFIVLGKYQREKKAHKGPRARIELRGPQQVLDDALLDVMPCVACGKEMHPFRERKGGTVYFAAACPLGVNVGCSRGRAAADEYDRIQADVERHPQSGQLAFKRPQP